MMKKEREIRLLTADPTITEAYNDIRSNLLPRLGMHPGVAEQTAPIVCVTAIDKCAPQELCANIAISFARLGLRVLLVDADYRGEGLASIFGTEVTPGLNEALTSEVKPRETTVEGLFFLPRGQYEGNPADLVGGVALTRYLNDCRSAYDAIFVSLPPASNYAEAATLAPRTNGVIVGVTPSADKRSAVTKTLEHLHTVGADLLGLVSVR